jgi:transglutaminase/protease-like cytokinesis protein 3
MRLLLLIPFFFISIVLNAQTEDYYRLYNRAKSTPEKAEATPEKLIKYLTKVTKSDKEKVQILYYWTALNISYDVELFQFGNTNTEQEDAFYARKAICQGYAEMFQELCKAANIPCEVIVGYAKGYGYHKEVLTETNHAWNAVRIGSQWKLVDVTWGGGYVEMKNDTLIYTPLLNVRYLLADPNDFLLEHFPEDKKWQLVSKKITKDYFFSEEFDTKRVVKQLNLSFGAN